LPCYASETALKVATKAIQIHGANGFTTDYVVERLYRDLQGLRLYDGTSEVQKIIVSKYYLK
jgi:alkylation response protein AidB-like acyl-CoA dehydrogenase